MQTIKSKPQDRQAIWQKIAMLHPNNIEMVFQCEQSTEIIERTKRIMKRIAPKTKAAHGFYDPRGFMESLEIAGMRYDLVKLVEQRMKQKVTKRDADLSIQEKANIIAGKPRWLRN